MNRLLHVLFLCLIVLQLFVAVLPLLAQDATISAAPAKASLWDTVLKVLAPAVWVSVGPIVTAGLTRAVQSLAVAKVPAILQVILSSVFSAIAAGLTGTYTDFPLTGETAAMAGAGGGAVAQVLTNVDGKKLSGEDGTKS